MPNRSTLLLTGFVLAALWAWTWHASSSARLPAYLSVMTVATAPNGSPQARPGGMKVLPTVIVTPHFDEAAPSGAFGPGSAAIPDRLDAALPRVRLSMPYYAFRRKPVD